jgi:hypothetical protein
MEYTREAEEAASSLVDRHVRRGMPKKPQVGHFQR